MLTKQHQHKNSLSHNELAAGNSNLLSCFLLRLCNLAWELDETFTYSNKSFIIFGKMLYNYNHTYPTHFSVLLLVCVAGLRRSREKKRFCGSAAGHQIPTKPAPATQAMFLLVKLTNHKARFNNPSPVFHHRSFANRAFDRSSLQFGLSTVLSTCN